MAEKIRSQRGLTFATGCWPQWNRDVEGQARGWAAGLRPRPQGEAPPEAELARKLYLQVSNASVSWIGSNGVPRSLR